MDTQHLRHWIDLCESTVTESSDEERANIVRTVDNEWRLPNLHNILPPEHLHDIVKAGFPFVTIYRAVPEGVTDIRPGDWVALTSGYAATHGRHHVIAKRVKAEDVVWAGTDKNEYFYIPLSAE